MPLFLFGIWILTGLKCNGLAAKKQENKIKGLWRFVNVKLVILTIDSFAASFGGEIHLTVIKCSATAQISRIFQKEKGNF